MITSVINGFLEGLREDTFTATEHTKIVVSCPTRGKKCPEITKAFGDQGAVEGLLTSPLKLTAAAEYAGIKQMGGIGNVLTSIDGIATAVGGQTIQQPWFDRSYWRSTKPLSFAVNLRFVAQTSAKTEVYDKCVYLVSLLYPREAEGGSSTVHSYIPPGPNLFSGFDESGDVQSGLLGGADSDYIEFRFGSLIHLRMCYLNSVDVTFSQVLDTTGYPHSADVSLKVTCFDNNFVSSDGKFQFTDYLPPSLNVGKIADVLKGVGSVTLQAAKGIGQQIQDLSSKFLPNAK